jgi:crossover junction endodeoxyribonuclease RuvC
MRVIGIDPGTALMGWGVLDANNGVLIPVDYGILSTPADQPLAQRLLLIHQRLSEILRLYQPGDAAVEELFFSRNAKTALAVGHARGVILMTLAQTDIAVHEYKPLTVKQALVGYGGAAKHQMQEMVRLTLRLQKIPRPDDVADALAIAICHAYTAPMARRIAEQE